MSTTVNFFPATTNDIVKFLYEDLLMPDDTYRIRTRKRAIAFIAPLAILPFGQILFKLSSMKFGTPSEIINLLVRVVIFMSVVLLWSTARYKRTVTDAMGFAFGLALNISYLFLVLTDPNTGSRKACGLCLGGRKTCCKP